MDYYYSAPILQFSFESWFTLVSTEYAKLAENLHFQFVKGNRSVTDSKSKTTEMELSAIHAIMPLLTQKNSNNLKINWILGVACSLH